MRVATGIAIAVVATLSCGFADSALTQTPPWRVQPMPWSPHARMPHPWRTDQRLVRWGIPAYPDDFQVRFANPDSARGGQHEVMWVRVTASDSASGLFLGVLLNAPHFLTTVRQADNVVFTVRADGYLDAVGGPQYPAAAWPARSSDLGPALREGLRAYRLSGNGNNTAALDSCIAILAPALQRFRGSALPAEQFIAHFVLGRCYAERYVTDSAITHFRAAVALDSTDLDAHLALLAEYSLKTHHAPGTVMTPAHLRWDTAFVETLRSTRTRFGTDPDVSQILSSIFDPRQAQATDTPADRSRAAQVGYAVFRWKRR